MDRILVIEDAIDFQLMINSALLGFFDVVMVSTLAQGRAELRARAVDLLILDVGLPDGNGFKFCEELRDNPHTQALPVFILSGRTEVEDRVHGLSIGADDYIVKPFEALELRARVENKLARLRQPGRAEDSFAVGELCFDLATLRAFRLEGGRRIDLTLTPIEYKILFHLARNETRVVSREQLIAVVWGEGTHVFGRATDKHVSSLRQKLGPCAKYVGTVSGVGYRFSVVVR